MAFYKNEKEMENFINITEILKNNNINVPNVKKNGKCMIILEDLGIEHFKSKNFNDFINIIFTLQNIDYKNLNIPLYTQNKIYEEMSGFLNKFLIKFLDIKLSTEEEKYILEFCSETSKKLFESKNKCLVHKDLNPFNILLKNSQFYLIDYQNALIGSSYYDLASLLFNEREILTEEQINEGINLFLEKSKFKDNFPDEFTLCSFHRILKNWGCFANFYLENKDEILIIYIKNLFEIALFLAEIRKINNLKKNPIFSQI